MAGDYMLSGWFIRPAYAGCLALWLSANHEHDLLHSVESWACYEVSLPVSARFLAAVVGSAPEYVSNP